MENKKIHKIAWIVFGILLILGFGPAAYAAISGIGSVAATAKTNLGDIAKLITAGSYVAGMAFGVGAVVKFKAHKDNPTQVHIGQPIALLFVGASLMFIPTVFKASGGTLFATSGLQAGISGISSF
jgi:intracellular multiplication protein IcmD